MPNPQRLDQWTLNKTKRKFALPMDKLHLKFLHISNECSPIGIGGGERCGIYFTFLSRRLVTHSLLHISAMQNQYRPAGEGEQHLQGQVVLTCYLSQLFSRHPRALLPQPSCALPFPFEDRFSNLSFEFFVPLPTECD